MNPRSVWQVAVWSNRLIICSYIVIFLGLSDILFIDGWVFMWSSLFMCRIILIKLVIVVVPKGSTFNIKGYLVCCRLGNLERKK